jgi:adenylate cyclase
MGLSYFIWGKFDEAAASVKKAIELDADDFVAHWTLGRIHFSTGQLEQAIEHFRRVIDLQPAFYVGYSDLGQSLLGLGRAEESLAVARQVVEMMPNYLLQNPDDSRARMFFAVTLLDVGDRAAALREGEAAIEASPGDSVMLYNAACLYTRLGETRRAVDTLRQAIAAGVRNFDWMKHDPDLNDLRDDAEFIELTRAQ